MSDNIPGLVKIVADGVPVANPVKELHFDRAQVTAKNGVVHVAFVPVIGATGIQGPVGAEGPTGPAAIGLPWAGNLPDGATLVVKGGEWVAVLP